MERNPFFQNLDDKPVALLHALTQLCRRPNQQIHWKSHVKRQANPSRNAMPPLAMLHDYQQIDI
jgi:hypothetical protein